jgi:hypothetical protein
MSMDTEIDREYDTSIGTRERSVVAATKVWVIVLAAVAVIGLVLLGMFLTRTSHARPPRKFRKHRNASGGALMR